MSAPVPSGRRLAIAIGTAAASATIAIGVTAASLLGWFRPAAEPSAPPSATAPVILVPVAPTPPPATEAPAEVQLAGMERRERAHHEHREDHDDDREGDHDDD